jgi:hypothetical protein
MDFRLTLVAISVVIYLVHRFFLTSPVVTGCENYITRHGALQWLELSESGQLHFELTCMPDGRHIINEPHTFTRFGVCPHDLMDYMIDRVDRWIHRRCDPTADNLDERLASSLRIKDPDGRPYLIPPDFDQAFSFPLRVSGKTLAMNALDVSPNEDPLILKDSVDIQGTRVWVFERFHSIIERLHTSTPENFTKDITGQFTAAVIVHSHKVSRSMTVVIRVSNELNIFISIEISSNLPTPPADECAICLETLTAPRTEAVQLPCRHWFHRECIDSWFSKKHTCPYCNQPAVLIEMRKPSWKSIFQF